MKSLKYIIPLLFVMSSTSAMLGQHAISFIVKGDCDMCKSRIEKISLGTPGVYAAEWSDETLLLNLEVDTVKLDLQNLHEKLAKAGHETSLLKADPEAYAALPACCHYNDVGSHKNHTEDQNLVSGIIYEIDNQGKKEPLIGAILFWKGTTKGAVTLANGSFTTSKPEDINELVISYTGYENDTVLVTKAGYLEIVLKDNLSLDEVVISSRRKTTEVSYISAIKMRKISQKELTKAACCNLSESFETSPSVDVSFTDAITGTKQIEMLGLASPYTQITRENMPDVRGLSVLHGLTYIPGPWVESIQLNLGTGSVINGYESIAGQINVELRKPYDKEKFLLNGYYGAGGRIEGNAVFNTDVSEKFDANVLLHYNTRNQAHDTNFDGFIDMPKGTGLTLANSWNYYGDNGNEGQFGVKITNYTNESGQDKGHHENINHPPAFKLWQATSDAKRYEAWIKRGKVFLNKENHSIGFQASGAYYNNKSLYGSRVYNALQKTLYTNLIYQTTLANHHNKISVGSSFIADQYEEKLAQKSYNRNEYVPGVFGEYTYSDEEKIDIVLGLRADMHNIYGLFFTPRLHTRYALSRSTVLRASAGRGQRTASIIAENIGMLASAREVVIHEQDTKLPYGLKPEVAWNYGINMQHDFNDKVQWGVDLYYTHFDNQIVVDFDKSPQQVHFYNLAGKSYATSVQTQVDATVFTGMDVRLAYRYNDVKSTYSGTQRQKPLISPQRAFINLAYEHSKTGIKLDWTTNWQDQKRLPDTGTNPTTYRLESKSKSFFVTNVQATKLFGKKYELYAGIENLFDFTQPNPILSYEDTSSKYFDASMVWGPIFGRMPYVGFRYVVGEE
jgi:outer membrane receptor for ferrienterochelin and colicins